VSRREEDYCYSFDVILNNKHTADRMFQQFIDLSNAFDEEWELKEKKEQIVQFFSIQHAQFLDVSDFTIKSKMPNFLEAYNRDLVVLMDKMIEYQVALMTFFQNKKKRSIYT
jgi:hypothetical protein